VSDLLQYPKEETCEEMMKLDEEVIKECLNVANNAPVILQLIDSETVHMVTHPNKGVDTDDEINAGTNEEHISTDKCIS
jgi:hypothetical protein